MLSISPSKNRNLFFFVRDCILFFFAGEESICSCLIMHRSNGVIFSSFARTVFCWEHSNASALSRFSEMQDTSQNCDVKDFGRKQDIAFPGEFFFFLFVESLVLTTENGQYYSRYKNL